MNKHVLRRLQQQALCRSTCILFLNFHSGVYSPNAADYMTEGTIVHITSPPFARCPINHLGGMKCMVRGSNLL